MSLKKRVALGTRMTYGTSFLRKGQVFLENFFYLLEFILPHPVAV